jgi:predicted AAA+ superfamily ATPase
LEKSGEQYYMHRNLLTNLFIWKNNSQRKPLLLYGARQVGKTYLLKKFAKNAYQEYLYLNFEDTPILKKYIIDNLNPKVIIYNLSIHFNQKITNQTLIIFDEIQECPAALNSLKYFNEPVLPADVRDSTIFSYYTTNTLLIYNISTFCFH